MTTIQFLPSHNRFKVTTKFPHHSEPQVKTTTQRELDAIGDGHISHLLQQAIINPAAAFIIAR